MMTLTAKLNLDGCGSDSGISARGLYEMFVCMSVAGAEDYFCDSDQSTERASEDYITSALRNHDSAGGDQTTERIELRIGQILFVVFRFRPGVRWSIPEIAYRQDLTLNESFNFRGPGASDVLVPKLL